MFCLSIPASSPPPAHLDKHVMSEKLETVIFQLRQVTRERDDLRKRLALSSPGTTFDDCRYSDTVTAATLTQTGNCKRDRRGCLLLTWRFMASFNLLPVIFSYLYVSVRLDRVLYVYE